jgi:hypothetical protein
LALGAMPTVTLERNELELICRGQFIDNRFAQIAAGDPEELVAVDDGGRLMAILVRRGDQWGASRNFASS